MIITNQYIIANQNSERFKDLEIELSYFSQFIPNQTFVYKYSSENITESIRKEYTAPRTLHKIALANHYHYTEENIGSSSIAVVLNHLECLNLAAHGDPDGWSLICEDDIFIVNKENFKIEFLAMFENRPKDAEIIWVSSGKKFLDASFRDVTGRSYHKPFKIVNNNFWKINLSRYADCILINNRIALEIANRIIKYKIAMPIDWEYNYILGIDNKINSYWLSPAIVMQNPKFF
jgi:hypothetical protein